MVYIYKRYDTETENRINKKIITGGLIAAAGLFFGALTFRMGFEQIGMDISISGFDLIKMISMNPDRTGAGYLFCLPAVASLIGLLQAAVAALRMRGEQYDISSKFEITASAIGALCPIVLMCVLMMSASNDSTLALFAGLSGEDISILPGIGTIMQIIGMAVTALAFRSRMVQKN